MRTHYRNGEEITLACGCDGCSPSMINGVLCHEHGCWDAWKDYAVECRSCGVEFFRDDRYQVECNDCVMDDAREILDDLEGEWDF